MEKSSQIALILPYSQLTCTGDWQYETTPLKSHDWRSGCQQIQIFDGRPDFHRTAHNRLQNNDQQDNDPWRDLETHRSAAAVVSMLKVRDCRDTMDLWLAEENLIGWARRYSHPLEREDIVIGSRDTRSILEKTRTMPSLLLMPKAKTASTAAFLATAFCLLFVSARVCIANWSNI